MTILVDRLDTPLGPMLLAVRDGALVALDLVEREAVVLAALRRRHPGAALAPGSDPAGMSGRLRRYFAGDLDIFAGVPIDGGGTPFQRQVWRHLRRIPAGTTTSYGAIAAALGMPTAARAVGAANARNPVMIAVPCHRVVGAGRGLVGYAGGLARKRWLLAHEAAAPEDQAVA